MLNPKTSERELCYLVTIDDVIPHNNADRLEIAIVGGWHCIVGKDEFKKGDIGVYFEIDSLLPEKEPFKSMEFLASKHFKIKTQKIRGELSQGFLVHVNTFIGTEFNEISEMTFYNDENRFLTEKLQVKYNDPADNEIKSSSGNIQKVDKYRRMNSRHKELFSHQPFRFLMRHDLGKWLLFLFFGHRNDSKKANWPYYVRKTDEERIQNMKWILENKNPWLATEKIDGSSLTVAYKPEGKDSGIFICSRNLAHFESDNNPYTRVAKKYNIPDALKDICKKYNLEYVVFQGEMYGQNVQKRDYGLKEIKVAGFNLIFSGKGRLNSVVSENIMAEYGIPWVPILNTRYILPDTVEELLDYAESETSKIDGGLREGIVFRSPDGSKSFKAVSNKFLLKYHS